MGQSGGRPIGVMPPYSIPVATTASSMGMNDAFRASSRRRTTPFTSARVVARTMHAATRCSPPRRPATTTQLADTSSGTSYAAQNWAVSARSGSISATYTSASGRSARARDTGSASRSGRSLAGTIVNVPIRGPSTTPDSIGAPLVLPSMPDGTPGRSTTGTSRPRSRRFNVPFDEGKGRGGGRRTSVGERRDHHAAGQGVERAVERHDGWARIGGNAQGIGVDGVHHVVVTMRPVALRRRCARVARRAGVVANRERTVWQRGVVGGAHAAGELRGRRRQVDDHPVPEATRRGGVRGEARNDVAGGTLRRAGPAQVRRHVLARHSPVVEDVGSAHRLAVHQVVALDREGADAG